MWIGKNYQESGDGKKFTYGVLSVPSTDSYKQRGLSSTMKTREGVDILFDSTSYGESNLLLRSRDGFPEGITHLEITYGNKKDGYETKRFDSVTEVRSLMLKIIYFGRKKRSFQRSSINDPETIIEYCLNEDRLRELLGFIPDKGDNLSIQLKPPGKNKCVFEISYDLN